MSRASHRKRFGVTMISACALGLMLTLGGCGSVGGVNHTDAGGADSAPAGTGGVTGGGTGGLTGTGTGGLTGSGGSTQDGAIDQNGQSGQDGGAAPAKWDVDLWDTALWS
jgi:hypothetical protein